MHYVACDVEWEIEEAIYDGINVNVTLLFAVEHYEAIAQAYIRGLTRRHAEGKPLNVNSVASFFVSRVDSLVDKQLDAIGTSEATELKGVAALGPAKAASGLDAINWMKANPSEDDCFGKASIRADGRFLTMGYLFQVKKPSQSKSTWDLFSVLSSTPADQAFRPMAEGGCSFIRG